MTSISQVITGGEVTLTASLSSSTALSGAVSFFDGSTRLGSASLVAGTASLTVPNISGGSHSFSAQYPGDSGNKPAASTADPVTAVASQVSQFAYHSKTTAWINAVNVKLQAAGLALLNRREKLWMDRTIKRLASQNLLSLLRGLQIYAASAQGSSTRQKIIAYTDIIDPSVTAIEVGAMTATLDTGLISSSSSSYIDTGIKANSAETNNCHLMLMVNKLDTETYNSYAGALCGALNAAGSGVSIVPYTPSTSAITARCNTSAASAASGAASNGSGFFVVSRPDSASFTAYRNGKKHSTISAAGESQATGSLYVGSLNNNGAATAGSTGYRYSAFSYGASLTAAQQKQFYAAIRSYVDAVQYGLVDYYEPGTEPANVSADIVVYGLTSTGIAAAYEAKRQGKSVALVGGWRDHVGNIGGMMAGGLGFSDFDNPAGLGGLSKWILSQIQVKTGVTTDYFNCRHANYTFKQMLDPGKLNGLDIPVYLSTGVASVAKTGTVINSFLTGDGRRFNGKYFVDASYEGDLMSLSGVSYKVGREASSAGEESMNGWRGASTAFNEGHHQFNYNGTLVTVDPFQVQGDNTSGLIYGVMPWPTSAVTGQPDYSVYSNRLVVAQTTGKPMTQAYNFRMMLASALPYQTDDEWVAVAPLNYFSGEFESLYRFDEACTVAGITPAYVGGILKVDSVGTGAYDANSQGGLSTDWWTGSWSYPEASYADREILWQAHMLRMQRLFYAHRNESRLRSSLRAAAQGYTLHNENFLDPYGNDPIHWPTQLYVREARRLLADYTITAADMALNDGSALRSIKTIALASYAEDSHHCGQYAHPTIAKIWNEGGFLRFGPGGNDKLTPVPYDAIVPKITECTNLLVTFCISSTHCAFGSIRMEFTACMMGQAAGLAAAIAIEAGNIAVQNVPYNDAANDNFNLRSRLLTSNTNSGETQPILPMVA